MNAITIGYLPFQDLPDAVLDFKRHAKKRALDLSFQPIQMDADVEILTECDFLFIRSQVYRWEWLEFLLRVKRTAPHIPVMVLVPERSVIEGCSVMRTVPSVILIDDSAYFVKAITRLIESRQMRSKQVLFVDDDENILNSYRHAFFRAPWKTHTASNARAALDILSKEMTDLVVTDIKMPGMHGIRLIEEIRKIDPSLPIIVCSGYRGLKEDAEISFHKVSAFMEKPLELPILEKKIMEVLS